MKTITMPKNWERKRLEDVSLSISAGGTPRRNIKEYWENGTLPWLKISDIKSIYIISSEEKITEKNANKIKTKFITMEDLGFSNENRHSINFRGFCWVRKSCSQNKQIFKIKK